MNAENDAAAAADQGSGDAYWAVMDSVTRIALAGFGGALAGLSVSRRRSLVGTGLTHDIVSASVASTSRNAGRPSRAGGRRRSAQQQVQQQAGTPYIDQDLPTTWAMACLTFAGIVEFSRLVSPTTLSMDLASRAKDVIQDQQQTDRSNTRIEAQQQQEHQGAPSLSTDVTNTTLNMTHYISAEHARTVSDYVVGGSIAGAVFKGGNVQTSAGQRLAKAAAARNRSASAASSASSITTAAAARTGFAAGLLPGAALGLVAGLLHVGASKLEDMLHKDTLDDEDNDHAHDSNTDTNNSKDN